MPFFISFPMVCLHDSPLSSLILCCHDPSRVKMNPLNEQSLQARFYSIGTGWLSTGARFSWHYLLHIRFVRSFLLVCCVVQGFRPFDRFNIEISHVRFAIPKTHTDLEIVVEHHVVLPEATRPIIHTQDSFLHLHLVFGATPWDRVVLSPSPPLANQGNTSFGSCHTATFPVRWQAARLCDGVATPSVSDTLGMCWLSTWIVSSRGNFSFAGASAQSTRPCLIVFARLVFVVVVIIIAFLIIEGCCIEVEVGFSGNHVAVHCVADCFIIGYTTEVLLVDGLTGFLLLHHAKDTVVQMLIEFLRVLKSCGAGGTLASRVNGLRWHLLVRGRICTLLAAVWWRLFYAMDRGKVALEDVCTIKAFLRRWAGSWAESTDHVPLVVSKGVTIFVVFASEAFLVISAGSDGAFLRSLRLMGKHMRFQILEWSTAVRMRATSPLFAIVIETIAIGSWTI